MGSIASIPAGQPCFTMIGMADPPTFEPQSLTPLYVQAADYIAARIASGQDEGTSTPLASRTRGVVSRSDSVA